MDDKEKKQIYSEHEEEVFLRACTWKYIKRHKSFILWALSIHYALVAILIDDKSVNIASFIKKILTGTL